MKSLLISIALLAPCAALADDLDCTFTTLCSPQTDCQTHSGVPFRFNVISGALSIASGGSIVFGTPLQHLSPPAFGAVFQLEPDTTLLLTVTGTGEAAMTQQDVTQSGAVTSVSYFGTCEPAA
jgi:hypothetical protein